jgi:hypothetical protein
MHGLDGALHRQQLVAVHDPVELDIVAAARDPPPEQLELRGAVRIADADPQQEAVELRLRQRVGALVLDRVLGASTRNGRSSSRVPSSLVTWRSCIASSSAACVFGGARLISSPSRMCVKIGPGWNRRSPLRWS